MGENEEGGSRTSVAHVVSRPAIAASHRHGAAGAAFVRDSENSLGQGGVAGLMQGDEAEERADGGQAGVSGGVYLCHRCPGLVKPDLCVPRRMRQRHEHLPATPAMLANVVLHDRVPASESVLVTKTLEDALRRVPPLRIAVAAIVPKPLLDQRGKLVELRSAHRRRASVARRDRKTEASSSRSGVRHRSGARPRARSFRPGTPDGLCDIDPRYESPHPPRDRKGLPDWAEFLLRRSGTVPPLPWSTLAPPFAGVDAGARARRGEHQEPCGNCAESRIFALFLNSQFERIPTPGLTEDTPDRHTILGALEVGVPQMRMFPNASSPARNTSA